MPRKPAPAAQGRGVGGGWDGGDKGWRGGGGGAGGPGWTGGERVEKGIGRMMGQGRSGVGIESGRREGGKKEREEDGLKGWKGAWEEGETERT